MKDIVRIGLKYIVSLDHDFENVVLLQHARVDILYLMVGYFSDGPLTQEIFESEESYPLTYYDNPLQPGIQPVWSDQNVLGQKKGKKKPEDLPRRALNYEEFQRRQKYALAMLENGPADPMAELEQKYRTKMLATAHQQARIAYEKSSRICGQDVYENDAELDVNEFTNLLAEQKKCREDGLPSQNASAASAKPACEESGNAEKSSDAFVGSSDATSMQKYESQGTDKVLGSNSDGVIFVARGGEVLRNEGPPKPSRHESVQTGEGKPTDSKQWPFASMNCYNLSCFQYSFKALLHMLRP
jgi:hypothetical protein